MEDSEKEIWGKICILHQKTKELTILSEEFSRTKSSHLEIDLNTFIQPINEQKHALEHIMRVRSSELEIHTPTDPEYTIKNLRKALGHIYRAFFDTADYFGIILREDILQLLTPYNSDIISRVIPDYYTTRRPKVEAISEEIADIRMQKDIGQNETLTKSTDHYTGLLGELKDIHAGLIPCIPAMDELKREERVTKRKKWLNKILFLIIGAALAGFFTWVFICPPQ